MRDPTAAEVDRFEKLRRRGMPIEDCCDIMHVSTKTWYEWERVAANGGTGLYTELRERVFVHSKLGNLSSEFHPIEWRRIDIFQEWAKKLVLDSGEFWEPEPWQLEPVADLLSDVFQAVWLIVPEGNGKTTLTAAVVLYLLEHQLTPEIPIGSATVTQAETLFRQIEGFIIRSGKLGNFNLAPGVKRIDCKATHGHTRVYPHNERSGDGVIPSGGALDELHLHPNLRLYQVWKGKYRKRRGPLFVISTAGEPDSDFEQLRGKLIKEAISTETSDGGCHIRAVSRGTVLHDWAVRDRSQAFDMATVARANPLSIITAEELELKYDEPEMTDEHWLRRTCNIASHAEGMAITQAEWDALRGDLSYDAEDEELRKYGFVDLGWKVDTTGIGVLAWVSAERRLVLEAEEIKPPVEEIQVVAALLRMQLEYGTDTWVIDPNAGGEQMVQQLEKGQHALQMDDELRETYGLPPLDEENPVATLDFIAHSQDNAPMGQAAVRFDEALRNGWLVHNGNMALRKHVTKAVKKPLGGEKWKYDRPANAKGDLRKKFPIDLLTGVLIANNVAVTEAESLTPLAAWS